MNVLDHSSFFVLGFGRSGRAVSSLLAGRGFSVTVCDDNDATVTDGLAEAEFEGLHDRIQAVTRGEAQSLLESLGGSATCMVLSPGVPSEHPLVAAAREREISVTGELEVAYQLASPVKTTIIGVTGTNGKSTVVSLVGDMLKAGSRRCVVAGNIGTPFSEVVARGLEYDAVVLEISSFQLDTVDRFRSDVAVLLNVTDDHLDRYKDSMDNYAASKRRILNRATADTVFVYNAEDPHCRCIAAGFNGEKIPFSAERELPLGVYVRDHTIVRNWQGRVADVLPVGEYKPIGVHNLENAMAAIAAVARLRVGDDDIRRALRSYEPLPHRMQTVRVLDGVTYIDDSKATNVDATIKSVRSINGPVILILGGLDKNSDFSRLRPHLAGVKLAILIGQAKDKIRSAISGACRLTDAPDLGTAVQKAREVATPGDTVLLAPACASFDMFRNYVERGERFGAEVHALEARS